MFDKSAIEAIQATQAIREANVAVPEGAVALPPEWKLHDVQHLMSVPARAKGKFVTPSLGSFVAYIGKADAPIFVQAKEGSAAAILNFSSAELPGHCDDLAIWMPERTAAMKALVKTVGMGMLNQQSIAEFCEDWPGHLEFYRESETIAPNRAIAAIRAITIDTAKQASSVVLQHSTVRSSLESVAANSKEPLPTHLYFKCQPFAGFEPRTHACRIAIHTGGSVPSLRLHIINQELHDEEINKEFIEKIQSAPSLKNHRIYEGGYSR